MADYLAPGPPGQFENCRDSALPAHLDADWDREWVVPGEPVPEDPLPEDLWSKLEPTDHPLAEDPFQDWALFLTPEAHAAA